MARSSRDKAVSQFKTMFSKISSCLGTGLPFATTSDDSTQKLHVYMHIYFTDSLTYAAGDGQQVDGPTGTLQDPSSQTENVHDEKEAIIAHASDKFTHHDPLRASADKHGNEYSRRHRHRSKSHSLGHCPVGNTARNGTDQKHRRTSCKAPINASTKGKCILSSGELREEYAEFTTSLTFAKALFFIYRCFQSPEY